jgi:UDP-N-acetylglucosamine transferase subunit ALG13
VIFVTVGAQMPFDRLVRAVDQWAGERGRPSVVAQIGQTDWRPRHIRAVPFMEPETYVEHCERADQIVAHAGTGSILTALQLGKPIVIMPRRAHLLETRNDHQVATVERFRTMRGVFIAADEDELPNRLDEVTVEGHEPQIGRYAQPQLIEALREFIHGCRLPH